MFLSGIQVEDVHQLVGTGDEHAEPSPIQRVLPGTSSLARAGRCIPATAQSHSPDYEDVDPWVGVAPPNKGPDSAAVAGFLSSLVTTNPVVCQFVVQSIGNNWGDWDRHYQPGYLVAEQGVEKQRQTLSRPVTDHAALSHLAACSRPRVILCPPSRGQDAWSQRTA